MERMQWKESLCVSPFIKLDIPRELCFLLFGHLETYRFCLFFSSSHSLLKEIQKEFQNGSESAGSVSCNGHFATLFFLRKSRIGLKFVVFVFEERRLVV